VREIELKILHWITCGESAFQDTLAEYVNSAWFGVPFFVLVVLFVALSKRGRERFARTAVAIALAVAVGQIVLMTIWKVAPRDRPGKGFTEAQILRGPLERPTCAEHPEMWVERAHPPNRPSFPSSHMMFAACAAGALAYASGWAAVVVWTYALLVGWGRLYWGKHWPSDIVGSLVLGALLGWLGWTVAGRVIDALRRRRAPPSITSPPSGGGVPSG
jgi:membrane-associated phospholipid phosphatase